jgi:hypothetical protein
MTKVVHCQKEDYDVYIGRPGKWGNPFRIKVDGNRDEVIKKYREWLLYNDEANDLRKELPSLKDKTLGCWCKPSPCHGDVIAEIIDNDILNLIT